MAEQWANYAIEPSPLSRTGDLVKNWYRWKETFSIFMRSAGYADYSSADKAAILRNKIGLVGLEALDEIKFENELDADNVDIVLEKLTSYFDPPAKESVERYKFFTRTKEANETFETYVNDLKEKAKTCNFGSLTESLIRDKVIMDVKDKTLRQLFFDETVLDVPKLIHIFKTYQINRRKINTETVPSNENNVKNEAIQRQENVCKPPTAHHRKPCWKCGTVHAIKKCPAYGHKCEKCNELNHYTQYCKNTNGQNNLKKVNKDKVETAKTTKTVNKVPKSNTMNAQPGCSNQLNLKPTAPDISLFNDSPSVYPNLNTLQIHRRNQDPSQWAYMGPYNIQPPYNPYTDKL